MTVLTAPGDTWGIPGPTFLALYLGAAALIVFVSLIWRKVLFAGRNACDADQLGPQQVAYLNGGARTALYAALGGLRAAGAVGATRDRRLAVTGPLPAGVTPLDRAVYQAAGNRVRTRDLTGDLAVVGALAQLRAGLAQRGMALGPGQRAAARIGSLLLLGLLLIGGLRLGFGLAGGKPIGFLVLSMVAVFFFFLVQMRAPYSTRAGRAALRNLRSRYAHLAPSTAPAYSSYGAAGAAMGVALFGAATLWALDPGFAAEAEIQRQAAGSSGSSGGGGDSGGGDGGGSSCGGGGGCGGGCGGCGG
ncbi:TIGR04222 domain-containing membrane protein [Micromonospora sp. CPCC 206060]|uniref:TIGR04222 domain-containing membrane protein n=1 Tax=Micromonospora sp. CPCC 206060 TaxID=3122406 RepID=UPI002FEF886F